MEYNEASRINVVEPLVSLKRDLTNARSISAKVVLDAITGASPTGAMPTDHPQTITSASGRVSTVHTGDMPKKSFRDHRASIYLSYVQPLLRTVNAEIGGHLSAESDYLSRGTTLTINWDTPDRLTTFSLGAGANSDLVEPTGGGKPLGLSPSSDPARYGNAKKKVVDGLAGISRVMSRSWLMQLNYSYTQEKGYLTEPYKVISILNADGSPHGDFVTENRPSTRMRHSVYLGSNYQFEDDVGYFSYRYYWDDWGIKAHTIDLKYRYEMDDGQYLVPHFRYYTQTAVNFFSYGLIAGDPLPLYATSDYRFGEMSTMTFGCNYAFPINDYYEFNIRLEYMRQDGNLHPTQAIGVQQTLDLFEPVNTLILQLGYKFNL